MQTKKITFTNTGGKQLAGSLEIVPDHTIAYAIFAHCFTCSKDYKAVTYISRTLAQAGIAVFRFDFTGLGQSKGEFSDTNFSSNVADILAAAEFLAQEHEAPQLLIGHSLDRTRIGTGL